MYDIVILAIVILVIDAIYLTLAGPAYGSIVRKIQGSPLQMKISGGVIAYAAIIFGLYWFIIRPNRSILDAFLLGVFSYGVYEGTTYAIFKDWPIWPIVLDTLWGGILFASSTFIIREIGV